MSKGDLIEANGPVEFGMTQADNPRELTELSQSSAQASAQHEMQAAVLMAKKFPRNEDASYQSLMRACKRTTFAEKSAYKFPRGGSNVTGPSIYLAREAARAWGNIRYGFDILTDDETDRVIRGWAWDIQTNAKVQADDSFKKLIFRKGKGWIEPDERDLRELTNRRAALLIRGCILQLIPSDIIEDAMNRSSETLRAGVNQNNIGEQRKKVIEAFDSIGVSVKALETYLGHELSACSPQEIVDLRGIYASIKDGQSSWKDYAQADDAKADPIADVAKRGAEKKAAAKTGTVEPKQSTIPEMTEDERLNAEIARNQAEEDARR